MAAKRNKKGQFVKGSGAKKKASGAKKKASGTKKKASGTKKKGAKKKASGTKKKGGASIASRVTRLEQKQATLTGVVETLERRVTDHDRAISQIRGVMGRRYSKAGG